VQNIYLKVDFCYANANDTLKIVGMLPTTTFTSNLGESTSTQKRREWISALDKIHSLSPLVVIAGHKRQGSEDSPKIIEETRQYIRDFNRVDGMTTTSLELYDKMLELYPNRVNPGMLWSSARAVKGTIPYE
jgi:hypothetical protein